MSVYLGTNCIDYLKINKQKEKTVKFIDYDGEILHEYSKDEFLALSSMPSNPTHTGLVSQGWNWSLSDAKDYVQKWDYLDIGQMYITQSGDTEIDICFHPDCIRLSPYLCIYIDGEVDIDWGDNSTHTVVTSTNTTDQEKILHTYAQPGNYTIKIHVNSGSFAFYSNTTTDCRILSANKASYADLIYSNTIKAIRVGENCELRYRGVGSLYSLQSITIPNTVTTISSGYIFQDCYSLKSITIPNTVTSIGGSDFRNCYSLQSVTIPNTVTSIGSHAFQNCYSLRSFILPNSLTEASNIELSGGAVFIKIIPISGINFHTSGLILSIPDGVTLIDSYAFQNCYSLQSITIPNTITSISNNAFWECCSLQSVTIPNTVTSIGQYAFDGCYSLQSITIPDTVTSIGSHAFNDCYSLQSIEISNGITILNDSVFRDCYSLQSIEIPDTITSIKSYSFYNCYCIQSVTIPDGVTSIGSYAFDYCHSLQSITIPNTVTSIGVGAFYNCYGLKECHLKPTTPPTLSGNVFTNIPSDFILYVPQGSLSAYQSATNWSTYASYMQEETN